MKSFQVLILVLVSIVGAVQGTECDKPIPIPKTPLAFNISTPNATTYKSPCLITIVKQEKAVPMYFKVTNMMLYGNDTLAVYNGAPGNNNTIIKFNQGLPDLSSTPVIFFASGNSDITFEWNSTKNGKSTFSIEVTPNNCSYTFSTVLSTVVSSPVYKAGSGSMQCMYTLTGTEAGTKAMVLSFDQVNIKKGNLSLLSGHAFESGTTSIPDQMIGSANVSLSFALSAGLADNGFTAVVTGLSPECTYTRTLTNTSLQVLPSPGYPGNYGNNLKCRVIINSPPGTKLWLDIEDFMMGDNTDHLMLKDGNSRSSMMLGDFNNMNQPEHSVLTSNNSVWIQFETDESKVSKGFRIRIRPILYGGLYRDNGYIRLENTTVHKATTKDIDDTIFIHLLADPVNQMVANFSVPMGVMLPSSTISCYEGFMYDPPKAIANFRHNTPFYPVFTNGPAMLIVLTGYLKNNTFLPSQTLDISFKSRVPDGKLQYSVSDQGSVTFTKAQVIGTTTATWLIPTGQVTSLKFSTLEVMPQYKVNVYSGLETLPVRVATFQTSVTSVPVMYLTNGVRVEYTKVTSSQRASVNNDTDQLPVLVASYQNIPVCGGEVNLSRSGVITSPMYPDRYPFNAECMWNISIPTNKSIHLGFTDFQLAANHSLKISVVTVITKNHTENITKIIGKFDSQSAPSDIITNGSLLVVEFSSASSVSNEVSSGFRMDIEVIDCGGNLTSSGKTFSTPGFPAVTKGNTTCVWIINLPPPSKKGNKNSVSFSYEIKGRKSNDTTSLQIRDGGNSQSKLLDIPTKDTKSGNFLSRYNQLYVSYRLQGADPNKTRGFAFQLKFESHECNKSMQCGSGICLHADWRCNGIDNCGDMTDERNCTAMPPKTDTHTGIKPWAVAVAVIITFLAAVLLTIFVPRIYNRIKNRRYGSLHEDISPEDT